MTFVENTTAIPTPRHRFYLSSPSLRPRRKLGKKYLVWQRQLDDLAARKFPTARMFFFGRSSRSCAIAGPKGAVYLTQAEATFLLLLLGSRLPKLWEEVSETLWPDPDNMPDGWLEVIRTRSCVVQKKLRMVGADFSIVCKWGEGFYISRSGAV